MHINTSVASSWNPSSAAGRGAAAAAPGGAPSGARRSAAGDTASISDAARTLARGLAPSPASEARPGFIPLGTNNAAPAGNAGLRKYLNIGSGTGATNLTAMNYSRKKLSDRIDVALKSAGIELRDDEKMSISVNEKNEIVVGGLKDKAKAEKIQEALNKDKGLAKEMRSHVAAGKINENAAKQEEYQKFLADTGQSAPENIDELFTSPDLRNYVVNEYLTENAGLGLSDLSLDYDEDGNKSIVGGDAKLQTLLSEDPQLGATIGSILESGDTDANFDVSFDYANGAVTDKHSMEMADRKVRGIKKMLDEALMTFTQTKLADTQGDPELEKLAAVMSRGFSVNVKANGEFEIAGLEDIEGEYRDTLENIVREAMNSWANDAPNAYDGGGAREANFADVYGAYMQEHQFEQGDTLEHEHELEINFGGDGSMRAISPEADKAQHAKNEEVAGKMGEALRAEMEEKGIDTSKLKMEIDEKGKITVTGDVPAAELEMAQSFVDQFVQLAKGGGASADDAENEADSLTANEAGEERRAMHFGDEEEKDSGANDVLENLKNVDESKLDGNERRRHNMNKSWAELFPRYREGNNYLGSAKAVSDVKPDRYEDTGDDSAANLYRRLMNDMEKFHDKPKSIRYAA